MMTHGSFPHGEKGSPQLQSIIGGDVNFSVRSHLEGVFEYVELGG